MTRRFTAAVLVACLALVTSVVLQAQQPHRHAAPAAPAAKATAFKPHPGPLPPFPVDVYPPARPREVVNAVYTFAARHPEVLSFIPCYCGCERGGHNGNHDCFVRSRDAQGRVTWDTHGYGCTICIDVAREAMTLFNAGVTVPKIRAAIDAKYRGRFPSATPTPLPRG